MRPIHSAFLLAFALAAIAANARADQDAFFDSDGAKLHYIVRGEGEPVLLIHGFSASASLNWGLPGVTSMLAEKYQVIAIDNRGHGQSQKFEDPKMYGVKMVEDAVRLLDHLGIKKAHVIGYSMGGMITLKLLTLHPERVASATIGGMGWFKTRFDAKGDFEGAPPGGPRAEYIACRRSWLELQTTEEEVKAIKVPMQVVIGDEDRILERWVRPLEIIRPDVPVVLVKGAGHTNCVAKPEFKAALSRFLAEHAGATGAGAAPAK